MPFSENEKLKLTNAKKRKLREQIGFGTRVVLAVNDGFFIY